MNSRGRFSYDVEGNERRDNRVRDEKNTIVHPLQSNFNNIVRTQTPFKIKIAAAKRDLTAYRNDSRIPGDRLDLGAMYRDIKQGKASPSIMAAFQAFRANKGMLDEVARPCSTLAGVELAADGKPMRRDNTRVDYIKDIPPHSVVVSRDVYQQLTQEQANDLTKHVGIHEYCKVQTGKVSLKNPTGEWPMNEKVTPPGVHIEEGKIIDKVYSFNVRIEATVTKLPPEPITFLSPHNFESFGLPTGTSIRMDEYGVTPGPPNAEMVSDKKIRNELANFRFSDPVGRHLDDIQVTGEVRRKYNGVFHYCEIKAGNLVIKTRNGVRYLSTVSMCDLQFAFELDGTHAHVIYVRALGLNLVPLFGKVQDFLCANLTIDIKGDIEARTDVHKWTFDGFVIRNNVGHFFLKDKKTVDITMHQAALLREQGFNVEEFGDESKPWVIYELTITKNGLVDPVLRLRNGVCDKVLPNHMKRIEFAMVAPTWSEYKKHHNLTMKQILNQI